VKFTIFEINIPFNSRKKNFQRSITKPKANAALNNGLRTPSIFIRANNIGDVRKEISNIIVLIIDLSLKKFACCTLSAIINQYIFFPNITYHKIPMFIADEFASICSLIP
jgi:hypothetical protein